MISNHVTELVEGVIEGKTRVVAISMTMEDIFKGIKQFKQEVFHKVQFHLNHFGLLLYNVNVKQLVDVQGHDYSSYLGQKGAANQARIDVAEAKMNQTIQNAAKIVSTQRHGKGKKQEFKVETNPTSASGPLLVLVLVMPWMPQLPIAKN